MVYGVLKKSLIGVLVTVLIGAFTIPLNSSGTTTDYLFVHNGDYLKIQKKSTGDDEVKFQYYSISARSRIDVYHADMYQETLIFKNTDGWQEYSSTTNNIVKIVIRETGTNTGSKDTKGDIPGCSDVVIRINSSEAKVVGKGHEDSSKHGKTCTVCGKSLTW